MSISIIQSITNIEYTDIAYVAMTPDGFYLTSENRLSLSLPNASDQSLFSSTNY